MTNHPPKNQRVNQPQIWYPPNWNLQIISVGALEVFFFWICFQEDWSIPFGIIQAPQIKRRSRYNLLVWPSLSTSWELPQFVTWLQRVAAVAASSGAAPRQEVVSCSPKKPWNQQRRGPELDYKMGTYNNHVIYVGDPKNSMCLMGGEMNFHPRQTHL